MKRFFALLLALLAVFCFAACGDDEQEDEQNGTNDTTDNATNSDDGFIFPGSNIPGGITLPEDTFD